VTKESELSQRLIQRNPLGLARLLRWKSKPDPKSGSAATVPQHSRTIRGLVSLCRDLFSGRDGISSGARAADAIRLYETLDRPGRLEFFDVLIRDFSPSPDDVGRAADNYRANPSPETLRRLQHVVEPPRQELFRRLNMAVGGTRVLIEMRYLALSELESNPQLEPIAADLAHLLGSWFNSGFLAMERIDWNSPAVVLEKLIEYEAVHQIQGWHDLRRRLEADRRCYAFFHSVLPNEPLVFIEVALTRGMSERIQPLIDPDAPVGDAVSADSAIFYSITNCQPGLRGVPLGSSLIKQVVEDLRKNLPRIRTFATLSPIPGFREWLAQERSNPESTPAGIMSDNETVKALALLDEPKPTESEWPPELKQRLLALCAWYLLNVKRGAEPLDSVARFHLRNGARVERINWMADPSTGGMRQSAGLMTNYLYELNSLQRNHELYARTGEISAAGRIERLARQIAGSKQNWLTRHFL
jgi:malonyl-CoA decarboxylase